MLSDLLTSSRGPGVIGTVFALIILLGFGGLFIMVSDDSGSFGGENLTTRIKSKKGGIRTKKAEAIHWKQAAIDFEINRKQKEQLRGLKRKVQFKLAEIERGTLAIENEKKEMVEVVGKFESYKKQYRIAERERAVGEDMKSLTTKSGEKYDKVSIRRVSALGVEIRHQNGFKRIHFEDLPDEMQDRFQFTDEDAQALKSTEQAAVKRADRGKKNYDQSVKDMRKLEILREYNAQRAKWTAAIARNTAAIQNSVSAIADAKKRAAHYRSLGNRGMNYDRAKKEEAKADRLQASAARAKSQNVELRRKLSQPPPR